MLVMSCGSLNENGPPRLLYLNNWYPVKLLGRGYGVALLEVVTGNFKSLHHIPDSAAAGGSRCTALSRCSSTTPLRFVSKLPIELFSKNCFGHGISSQQQNRN